jgi:glycosyltransferase involved in cell wall biosynthesis
VNRNFKDPRKGFETIKDALSRVDQKEFELTLVGSNSDWVAKDLKGGIGVRNLDYLHDRALVRPSGESEIFLFASLGAILAAMAAGCGVVVTPSGVVAE